MEKFKFKPFDRVLVRSGNCVWKARHYCSYNEKSRRHYETIESSLYDQCIPFEGNEHLLGTSDPYEEPEQGQQAEPEQDEQRKMAAAARALTFAEQAAQAAAEAQAMAEQAESAAKTIRIGQDIHIKIKDGEAAEIAPQPGDIIYLEDGSKAGGFIALVREMYIKTDGTPAIQTVRALSPGASVCLTTLFYYPRNVRPATPEEKARLVEAMSR